MSCDRCGKESEADMTRWVAYQGDQEVRSIRLCTECAYGLTPVVDEYVSGTS